MYVAEKIGNEYISWKLGDLVTITAGTGKGKSQFIKNELYNLAKSKKVKILFLVHRANTLRQFEVKLKSENKDDFIELMLYQELQRKILEKQPIDLTKYHYIVCDEYHYFSNDSNFNKYTDVALDALLAHREQATIVLMSATNYFIKQYIKESLKIDVINYEIEISYDFIKSLEFYITEEELSKRLDYLVQNNIKSIIFMDSAKKSYEVYKQFKEISMFVCSEGNTNFAPKMDKDKKVKLLSSQKFDDLFLFTTQTLDAGVSIFDDDLDCIVADIGDIETLIQCLGRKRLENEDDHVKLLLRNRTSSILGNDSKRLTNQLQHVTFLKENGENAYAQNYYRNADEFQIVYYEPLGNGTYELRINDLAYKNILYKKQIIEDIKSKPSGYMEYIEELFNKTDSILHDRYLNKKARELLDKYYKESIVIENKEAKNEFAEILDFKSSNGFVKTIVPINRELGKKRTPYRIECYDSRRNGIGDKKAWIVKKLLRFPSGDEIPVDYEGEKKINGLI
ncbi:hypothetical protein KD050_07410 [Psychrobacillus sp. INOP01]|uniref:DEAD/DEAH box helicase family protein n=1 Tax=Psychrobacillus sp. INOP01 TaxID=2829187 RepID=UPI001BAB0E03|nr:DEAD/DEAH box helicase family protein [Psychrobacillus sp. INOP01]QUG43057.1 hypothetical protein KD050_07410 [Psychrobacillus sp. INOP01]